MRTVIKGENITKSFGSGEERRKVLNNISLEVGEGEFVAVMGPSGSGKSTLMYSLCGMEKIDQGELFFGRQDLTAMSEKSHTDLLRNDIGFVFQQPILLKNLTILDNIILPAMNRRGRSSEPVLSKARGLMEKTGITGLEERDITQASGGQLQRVGICRALINSPKILFTDEPTGALNSQSAHEVMNLFSRINDEGVAVLLVTHDARVAARSRRILFMHDGQIVRELRFDEPGGPAGEEKIDIVTKVMRELGI